MRDDLAGGIVYWAEREPGVGLWLWLRAGSAEPHALPGEVLHQVAEIEGRRTLVATERLDEGEDRQQRVVLHDLESGETRHLAWVAGIEQDASKVSYAAGLFAVTHVDHSCGSIFFLDLAGERVEIPGTPASECLVHFEVPFAEATLSPDGRMLAYVEQTWENVTGPVLLGSELVVLDLETGDELLREVVTDEDDEHVISLDFDGEWIVLARTPPGSQYVDPASEVVGIHLEGARFRATVPGVTSVWLPRAPLDR